MLGLVLNPKAVVCLRGRQNFILANRKISKKIKFWLIASFENQFIFGVLLIAQTLPTILKKPMLNKILFLILTISLFSCQSQTDANYADELKSCLSDKDVELLNKATSHFEKLLSEHYQNTDNNENFINYLSELGSIQTERNFTADFYQNSNSIEIVDEMEKNGTFGKIWTEFIEDEDEEEIPIVVAPGYEEPEKEKIELYVLNSNGLYLECINKVSNNKGIKEILNSQSEYGDVAPTIIAGAMKNEMKKTDFDSGLNKTIIAIGFYYDIVNLLNKNPR